MLVERDYQGLATLSRGKRLSAPEIERAISDYGRHLVMPPDKSLSKLDCVEVSGANPRAFGIRVDLWTAEEGRSDLSLEFTVRGNDEQYVVEIDDLPVL